ncbi:hypothetical protein ACYEXS_36390 [Paenibacillus sp. MAH-36]|uniref:Uncharacterized protein n=1 Tax=Paenibacillus violae TaxID=3077234 RepID=A0ABU3RQX2_9BACL|nr:hypothetical protein [Paenibacillus sp. PFR10]MDU0206379.1 hypothetical protein [Paenibacillus sp. PFR10]
MSENNNINIILLTNAILKDNKLSFKAKGLYFNLIFLNEEQNITLSTIKKMSQVDSDRTIKMGLTELEQGRYIIRKSLQGGEVSWDINKVMNKEINKEPTVLEQTKKNKSKKPIAKKAQPKKSTRTRKSPPKNGLNRALSNFFKEFF